MPVSALAKSLVQAQAEFPAIERSKAVRVQTKTGGSYTFSYAPLDVIFTAIRPVLGKHGLGVSQLLSHVDGKPAIKTVLLHEGGEMLEATCPLPVSNGDMSAQEYGSLVTYFRRYALVTALGIATEEDDDGNHASGNTATQRDHDAYVKATKAATKPSEAVIHFGKNKGKPLGELTLQQLMWYAEKWTLQEEPSEYDHHLKAAAVALAAGDDEPFRADPFPDVPFA